MRIGATLELPCQQAPTFDSFKENLGFLWNGTLYGTAWGFRQSERKNGCEMYGLVFPTMAERGSIIMNGQQLRNLHKQINAVMDAEHMSWHGCGTESPWSFYQNSTNLYKLCFPGYRQLGELLISAGELLVLTHVIERVARHGLIE